MFRGEVELVKYPYNFHRPPLCTGKVIDMVDIDMGGEEGKKYAICLDIYGHHGGVRPDIQFIAKEYGKDERSKVLEAILAYDILRNAGYPVPATTRYFTRNEKHYLLMSDITCGGKYLLWGYNDIQSNKIDQVFKDMQLPFTEFFRLREVVRGIADQASRDQFLLRGHQFHIRKEIETGLFDIVLLDLNGYVVNDVILGLDTNWLESENSHIVGDWEKNVRWEAGWTTLVSA